MSVADDIAGRLADGDVVIIDGGTGTALQAAGVPMDGLAWSGRASLEQPDVVQAVHESYVRAGAEVIIANTFAASRAALEPAGLGDQVAETNRRAVAAAQRARDAAAGGRPVAVAGSMSAFCPIAVNGRAGAGDWGFPSLADYREQAGLLADAGVDLIALELMEAPSYGRAALQAAVETGLPVWLGISAVPRDDGVLAADPELGEGDTIDELVRTLADPALAAITVMHCPVAVIPDSIDIVRRHFAGPVGAYAETGGWEPPHWVFSGIGPEAYLREATTWADRGAQLIGGCCGVGPDHIRALAAMRANRARP
jgi:S-methylmethionine-dependent homocysteine/selenocysteine methylase